MKALVNYIKLKIKNSKDSIRRQYKNKEIETNEAIIIIKQLNSLKYEAELLDNENLTKAEKLERGATIEKISYILENYKYIEPIIEKNYEEIKKKLKKEEENER